MNILAAIKREEKKLGRFSDRLLSAFGMTTETVETTFATLGVGEPGVREMSTSLKI